MLKRYIFKNASTLTEQICDGTNCNSYGTFQIHRGPRNTYTYVQHTWMSGDHVLQVVGLHLLLSQIKGDLQDTVQSWWVCVETNEDTRGGSGENKVSGARCPGHRSIDTPDSHCCGWTHAQHSYTAVGSRVNRAQERKSSFS